MEPRRRPRMRETRMQTETVQRGSACVVRLRLEARDQVWGSVRGRPMSPMGWVRMRLPLGAAFLGWELVGDGREFGGKEVGCWGGGCVFLVGLWG